MSLAILEYLKSAPAKDLTIFLMQYVEEHTGRVHSGICEVLCVKMKYTTLYSICIRVIETGETLILEQDEIFDYVCKA